MKSLKSYRTSGELWPFGHECRANTRPGFEELPQSRAQAGHERFIG